MAEQSACQQSDDEPTSLVIVRRVIKASIPSIIMFKTGVYTQYEVAYRSSTIVDPSSWCDCWSDDKSSGNIPLVTDSGLHY